MKPKIYDVDLDAQDRDGIAQAQHIVAATAMTLNGALGTTLDYARIIGIYSGADCSSSAFTIVGTNANGQAISETIATGPNAGTVVSTKLYKTITSVTPSATVAQDVEVGTVNTTLSAETPVFILNSKDSNAVTIAVDVTGTIDYTVYESFSDPFTTDGVTNLAYFSVSALAAKTADVVSTLDTHARAVKLQVNSYSSGAELQMYIISGSVQPQ